MLPLTSEPCALISALSAARIAEVTGGSLLHGEGLAATIATSARDVTEGSLYVDLEADGAAAAAAQRDAIARGAAGLLVSRAPATYDEGCFVVRVGDPRAALLALAAAHRAELELAVVGVTGTFGKRVTCSIAVHLLSHEFAVVGPDVEAAAPELDVAQTLLRADTHTECAIVEIATRRAGDVARLAACAAPTIAVVTAIGRGHLDLLGSVDGVLAEKAALLDALPRDGTVILNADDTSFEALAARARPRRVATFALRHDADLRAESIRPRRDGISMQIVRRGVRERLAVELPRLGTHDVRALLAAFSVASALGVELEPLVGELASLPEVRGRLERRISPEGVWILDDSSNANPESLAAALTVLDTASGVRARVLVLGDMLELGPHAPQIHAAVGRQLVGRIDRLITVGPLAGRAAEEFAEGGAGAARVVTFLDTDALLAALPGLFAAGDLVLFKGAPEVGLARAVDRLAGGRRDT